MNRPMAERLNVYIPDAVNSGVLRIYVAFLALLWEQYKGGSARCGVFTVQNHDLDILY